MRVQRLSAYTFEVCLSRIKCRKWRPRWWLALYASIFFTACTALETSQTPSARLDERKPHVGQYYLLPKSLISIEGTSDSDGNYLVSSSLTLVADNRYKYFLNWKSNPFSEDIISNLEVGADGMLTSVNYSSEDKTPAIIGDIVTTGINVFKMAGQLGLTRANEPVKRPPFKYTFDPFDAKETDYVCRRLNNEQKIALSITPDPTKVPHLERASDPEGGGVFYHPPTTIEMLLIDQNRPSKPEKTPSPEISSGRRANTKSSSKPSPATGKTPAGSPDKSPAPSPDKSPGPSPDKSPAGATAGGQGSDKSSTATPSSPATRCRVVMTVPDLDRVVCFRLGRAFMTKREANLTFAHGMPGKLVFKQPSGVQAVTGTLSAVTSTVGGVVPTLIKVSDDRKIAALQEQSSLATEQSKLLEAQKKLIDDQQALAKAKEGLPQSTNRSDDGDMQQLRTQIQQQQKNITNMRQNIKEKLQSSDLAAEDKRKAIEAAGLDQDEP